MKKTHVLAVVLLLAGSAQAGPVEDSITRQLLEQGFDEIRVSRTLLGRSRIVATNDDLRREIVVNPATGEILRDYIRRLGGGSGFESIFDPTAGGGAKASGGKGGKDDDDDDDDDDDEDYDDDDRSNSGSGSSNSGSGSGNSGSGSGNSGRGGGDDDDDDDD